MCFMNFKYKAVKGFSLIELIATLSVIAIITSFAIPTLNQTYKNKIISNNISNFISDVRFTRSESIRLGGGVTMCNSNNPEDINPKCNTSLNQNWTSGWIIIKEIDSNNFKYLRIQKKITTLDSISSDINLIKFNANGRISSLTGSFLFGGKSYSDNIQRLVCVGFNNSTKIAAIGSNSC